MNGWAIMNGNERLSNNAAQWPRIEYSRPPEIATHLVSSAIVAIFHSVAIFGAPHQEGGAPLLAGGKWSCMLVCLDLAEKVICSRYFPRPSTADMYSLSFGFSAWFSWMKRKTHLLASTASLAHGSRSTVVSILHDFFCSRLHCYQLFNSASSSSDSTWASVHCSSGWFTNSAPGIMSPSIEGNLRPTCFLGFTWRNQANNSCSKSGKCVLWKLLEFNV